MEPRVDSQDFLIDDAPSPAPPMAEEPTAPRPAKPRGPRRGLPLAPLALTVGAVALVVSFWNLWSGPEVQAAKPLAPGQTVALTADQAARLEKRVLELEHLIASPPAGAGGESTQAARVEKLRLQVGELYQRIVGLERRLAGGGRVAAAAPAVARPAERPAPPVADQPQKAEAAKKAGPQKVSRSEVSPQTRTARKRIDYQIKRGDSLWSIAKRYGVTVRNIKAWNPRIRSGIKPGQKIVIYRRG